MPTLRHHRAPLPDMGTFRGFLFALLFYVAATLAILPPLAWWLVGER